MSKQLIGSSTHGLTDRRIASRQLYTKRKKEGRTTITTTRHL